MALPPKIKAGCGVVMLFSAGAFSAIIGLFLLLVILIPRSEDWKQAGSKDFLAKHFSKKVKLTEEQKEKLRPGFNDYLNQRWQLRANYIKEDREMLEQYLETVEPELTPEQLKRAEIVKERWWKGKQKMVSE